MTDKEILYKAIIKTENHGYKEHLHYLPIITGGLLQNYDKFCMTVFYEHKTEIIFSHSFAKAFWGEIFSAEDRDIYGTTCYLYDYSWQLHLTSLVLEENPLKYLEKFL